MMHSKKLRSRGWTAALLFALPWICAAHGLLLDAESDGQRIFGSAYYSSGEVAVNESIALVDLSTPDAPAVNAKTDSSGAFSFDVVRSHRYRVTVYGDEGHSVEVEVLAEPKSVPKLIDNDAQATNAFWPPPAWAIIGAILLLSLVPAVLFRKRSATPEA